VTLNVRQILISSYVHEGEIVGALREMKILDDHERMQLKAQWINVICRTELR
jgi:hypothetical protein